MYTDDKFLVAQRNFDKDEVVIMLGTTRTDRFDSRRIQVDDNIYILPPAMIYHSCRPNSYIKWDDMSLRALNTVQKNEVITYHYGTSEYDYEVGKFACNCGNTNCLKYFSGFKDMTLEQQKSIEPYLSEYIRSLWEP